MQKSRDSNVLPVICVLFVSLFFIIMFDPDSFAWKQPKVPRLRTPGICERVTLCSAFRKTTRVWEDGLKKKSIPLGLFYSGQQTTLSNTSLLKEVCVCWPR